MQQEPCNAEIAERHQRGLRRRKFDFSAVPYDRYHNARNDGTAAGSERKARTAAERQLDRTNQRAEGNRNANNKYTRSVDREKRLFETGGSGSFAFSASISAFKNFGTS